MKPLAIFGVLVAVGLAVIFAGLRLTDHSARADPLPATPTSLTHAQLVRAGNAVCDRYYRTDPTIFRNPQTLKAITRDMRIGVPYLDRMEMGLRALVPPPSDAFNYRHLLGGTGQMDCDAHAMLHAFETGQVQQGVLIARATARLDLELNSLAKEVGLNICALSDRQVRVRYGKRSDAVTPTARESGGAAAPTAGKAHDATRPRLEGRYTTVTKVIRVQHNTAVYPGETSRRTWSFIPRCTSGGCVTTLLRPSLLPGSRTVYKYKLRSVGGNSYRGQRSDRASCQVMKWNGRVSVLRNSFIDYSTITVHVIRTQDGRVTAYNGTFLFRSVPQAAARAHGCTAIGHQWITFRSVQRLG